MNDTEELTPRLALVCGEAAFWSLVALVTTLPLVLNPYGNAYFDTPKLVVVRGLTMLGVAAWALSSVLSGRFKWVRTSLDWPLLALVASGVVTTALALNGHVSFFGGLNTFDGLLNLICHVALFYLAVNFVSSTPRLRVLLVAFLGSSVLVSLIAVLERVGLHLLPGPLAPGGVDPSRSSATFGNPVHLGAYLALVIPITVALVLYLRVKVDASRDSSHRQLGPLVWAATALLSLQLAAIIFTQGRAAWLGVLLGIVLVLIVHVRTRDGFRRQHILLAVVVALATVVIYGSVRLAARESDSGSIARRAESLAEVSSGTAFNRLYMWKMTLPMIAARPLAKPVPSLDASLGPVRLPMSVVRPIFGYGFDFYLELFPKWRPADWYRSIKEDAIPAQPHNDLLQVAMGQGLAGLVAYLAVLGAFFFVVARGSLRSTQLVRRYATAGLVGAAAAYILQLQFSFIVVGVAPLFWVMAGLAVSLANSGDRGARTVEVDLPTASPAVRFAVGASIVAMLAIGGVGLYRVLAADATLRAAQDAMTAGYTQEALELLNSAADTNPNETRFPMVAARFCSDIYAQTKDGAFADAGIRFARTAQRLNPFLTEPLFTEAGIYRTMAGRADTAPLFRAERLYRQILQIDQYNEDALFNLGITLYDLRSYPDAGVMLKRAVALKPNDADAHVALGAAFVKIRRFDEARSALRTAVRLKPDSSYAREQLKALERRRTDSR